MLQDGGGAPGYQPAPQNTHAAPPPGGVPYAGPPQAPAIGGAQGPPMGQGPSIGGALPPGGAPPGSAAPVPAGAPAPPPRPPPGQTEQYEPDAATKAMMQQHISYDYNSNPD